MKNPVTVTEYIIKKGKIIGKKTMTPEEKLNLITEEILLSVARTLGDVGWDRIEKATDAVMGKLQLVRLQERERIIEMIKEMKKITRQLERPRRIDERYERERENGIADFGYNQALEDILKTLI